MYQMCAVKPKLNPNQNRLLQGRWMWKGNRTQNPLAVNCLTRLTKLKLNSILVKLFQSSSFQRFLNLLHSKDFLAAVVKNWIDISSGPIDTPDVASHCIALRCNLRSLHVPSRPIPYLSLISTWNSSLFVWYNVKRNHWDTRCCIAMHCSPRVALHCIAAPDISMFPILHSSVLESYQYLKLFHIQLTISSKVFDRVNQFNLCPNANQYLQKVFDPFKPHNLDNLFKPVKRALTLFPKTNQLSTSKAT